MAGKLSGVAVIKLRALAKSATLAFICELALASHCYADLDMRLPRVIISSGGPYQSRSLQIQTFKTVIDVPPEYAQQPMSFVATDGSESAPGFAWVRMFLLPEQEDSDFQQVSQPIGRLLVDASTFAKSAQVYVDLSSQLRSGRNRVLVEGAGQPGSVFTWELRSIGAPRLFEPQGVATAAGEWLTIYGAGFSSRPAENIVQIGPTTMPVSQSDYGWLRVGIPKNFPPGEYDFAVSIRDYRSRVIKLTVYKPQNQGGN